MWMGMVRPISTFRFTECCDITSTVAIFKSVISRIMKLLELLFIYSTIGTLYLNPPGRWSKVRNSNQSSQFKAPLWLLHPSKELDSQVWSRARYKVDQKRSAVTRLCTFPSHEIHTRRQQSPDNKVFGVLCVVFSSVVWFEVKLEFTWWMCW